jgi:hypothetical protein
VRGASRPARARSAGNTAARRAHASRAARASAPPPTPRLRGSLCKVTVAATLGALGRPSKGHGQQRAGSRGAQLCRAEAEETLGPCAVEPGGDPQSPCPPGAAEGLTASHPQRLAAAACSGTETQAPGDARLQSARQRVALLLGARALAFARGTVRSSASAYSSMTLAESPLQTTCPPSPPRFSTTTVFFPRSHARCSSQHRVSGPVETRSCV